MQPIENIVRDNEAAARFAEGQRVGKLILELDTAITVTGERMLPWFRFGHLKAELANVSAVFARAALDVVQLVPASAERTVALRKLLEGKDAAVRAAL